MAEQTPTFFPMIVGLESAVLSQAKLRLAKVPGAGPRSLRKSEQSVGPQESCSDQCLGLFSVTPRSIFCWKWLENVALLGHFYGNLMENMLKSSVVLFASIWTHNFSIWSWEKPETLFLGVSWITNNLDFMFYPPFQVSEDSVHELLSSCWILLSDAGNLSWRFARTCWSDLFGLSDHYRRRIDPSIYWWVRQFFNLSHLNFRIPQITLRHKLFGELINCCSRLLPSFFTRYLLCNSANQWDCSVN